VGDKRKEEEKRNYDNRMLKRHQKEEFVSLHFSCPAILHSLSLFYFLNENKLG
jgi:hypothetical protein